MAPSEAAQTDRRGQTALDMLDGKHHRLLLGWMDKEQEQSSVCSSNVEKRLQANLEIKAMTLPSI